MGSGSYTSKVQFSADGTKTHVRANNAATSFFASASPGEIFKQKQINNAMSPHGVKVRESRDSKEHPRTLAILLALDVTGSMGSIPYFLVKKGLPNIMGHVIESGVKDPQVLFVGIGDHECDDAPLQVGQFESSDDLLDKWLTDIYLEGGGGGNAGESYLLAWYFGAYRTSIDCFEKRKQKGLLITIGDEPVLEIIPKSTIKDIMGEGQYSDFNAKELLDKARKTYNVYHIHIASTASGSRKFVQDDWKQLMSDNCIIAQQHEDVEKIIVDIIKKHALGESKAEDMML